MRYLLVLLCLFVNVRSALAASSRVWWNDWTIHSSEELSQGEKYHSYPLPLMLDGNPKTAWVYSATSQEWDHTEWASRYGVKLGPSHPVVIDGLRIMNGHNRSRERFYRNNRAVQLRVDLETKSGHVVRSFRLPDTLGWHTVKLPRTLAKSIKIGFTGIKRGPANDLCISELQLLRKGVPLNLHMPKAVMFCDGFEGCNSGYLISHSGVHLAVVTNAWGDVDLWSADGRYVGSTPGDPPQFWIADVFAGKVIEDARHWKLSDSGTLSVQIRERGRWVTKVLTE